MVDPVSSVGGARYDCTTEKKGMIFKGMEPTVGLLRAVKWVYPAMNCADEVKVASVGALTLHHKLQAELHHACRHYYQGELPPSIADLLLAEDTLSWAAPLQGGDSTELLLVGQSPDNRVCTLRLEVFTGNDRIEVLSAYWQEQTLVQEAVFPRASDEAVAEDSRPLGALTDSFLAACLEVGQHKSLYKLLQRLREHKSLVINMPLQSDGVPIERIGILSLSRANNSEHVAYSGAIVSATHLPGHGVLLEDVRPGTFVARSTKVAAESAVMDVPEQHRLASEQAALQGVTPELIYSDEIVIQGRAVNISVFAKAPFDLERLLPHLTDRHCFSVAMNICSKLAMMHQLQRAHGSINLENIVIDISEEQQEVVPCHTWLMEWGTSVDLGSWYALVSKLEGLGDAVVAMARLAAMPLEEAERRQELLVAIGDSLSLAGEYTEVVEELKQQLQSLLKVAYSHVGNAVAFRDPRLTVLANLLIKANKLLQGPVEVDWSSFADCYERILFKLTRCDLIKADIWSLGVCLLRLALPEDAEDISRASKRLYKSFGKFLSGKNKLSARMAEGDIAQGWRQYIHQKLYHLSANRGRDDLAFAVALLEAAGTCFQDSMAERSSAEGVREMLQLGWQRLNGR